MEIHLSALYEAERGLRGLGGLFFQRGPLGAGADRAVAHGRKIQIAARTGSHASMASRSIARTSPRPWASGRRVMPRCPRPTRASRRASSHRTKPPLFRATGWNSPRRARAVRKSYRCCRPAAPPWSGLHREPPRRSGRLSAIRRRSCAEITRIFSCAQATKCAREKNRAFGSFGV